MCTNSPMVHAPACAPRDPVSIPATFPASVLDMNLWEGDCHLRSAYFQSISLEFRCV